MKIDILENVLKQDLTRRQFLQLVGSVIISLLGFKVFASNLQKAIDNGSMNNTYHSYGGRMYGR